MGNNNAAEQQEEKKTSNVSEFVVVPPKYKDPITHKIMKRPTMVLSSMSVYDHKTITKWMESKRGFDPLTGIPMALGKWPVILEPRVDLQIKIEEFIKENPSYKSQVFNEKDESIDWKILFESYDQKIRAQYQQILDDQSSLRFKAKPLFKSSDDIKIGSVAGDISVMYDDSIVLRSDIPVICIMGPSRNGKSTIVNDILDVKQACATSTNPNVALTKGAWIAKYSTKPKNSSNSNVGDIYQLQDSQDIKQADEKESKETKVDDECDEFYLLDMEGLSHDVTKFTKRIFYACYATANVVVWNDKEVASDRFRNLMSELKEEMKPVKESKTKPIFLYLKRDCGDFDCDPFDTLDEYINKHESLAWFREMNIFSSLSAYELERPSVDKQNKKIGLNFHSKQENRKLLTPLIKKLLFLSKHSTRFSSNMYKLKQQIEHVNNSTALSMTKQLILDNDILNTFVIHPKGHKYHRRDMVYIACEFNWDHGHLEKKFSEEMSKLQELVGNSTVKSEKIIVNLTATKNEIYERIKNKTLRNECRAALGGLAIGSALLGGAAVYAVVMTGGAAAVLLGTIYVVTTGISATVTVGSGVVIAYQWLNGNYTKYSLGRTDLEIEQDKQKITVKTPYYSLWDDDFVDFQYRPLSKS
eukprot:143908_1